MSGDFFELVRELFNTVLCEDARAFILQFDSRACCLKSFRFAGLGV